MTSPLYERFRPLAWLGMVFLAVSFLVRLGLLLATGSSVPTDPGLWMFLFGIGLGYDVLAFLYLGTPLLLLLWLLPRRWLARRGGSALVGATCLLLLLVILFVAVAECTFWAEFQVRFNFIAVDYLVYTTEVLGNIRESYPVGWILTAIGGVALAAFVATRRWRAVRHDSAHLGARTLVAVAWIGAGLLGTWLVTGDMKDRTDNSYVNELAGNGIYQFFAAYRSASLDYDRFYRSLPLDEAFATVRRELATPDATFDADDGIERRIHNAAPERRLNVVLISVESLSAEYSGTYGASPSLTPQLDALSRQSLVFSNLYASGTRTVRGLEAIALSVPPTPGESIVKRAGNTGLYSLADVFNAKGYRSEFLYGGYGAFDNMNAFFGGNGYEVHDRTDIAEASIHHENIWGVADEDMFTMALAQFDHSAADGKPFFAQIMTTSNHRPYTFPSGRGDWPQGKRESAVAYTDWALGDFLRRARTRPWFKDTVFVITADHCASSAGIAALPAFRYHIPMWIYSPGNVAPGRFDALMGQVDIGPTVLGLLGMDYDSHFYGLDVFQHAPGRAYIGTYELLGYLVPGKLVILAPHRRVDSVRPAGEFDHPQPPIAEDPALSLRAISAYQTAAWRFTHGHMRAATTP